MELLIDVKFDGCVKSHFVVVREGRGELVPFAALCLQSLRGERETLRTHMRLAAPSCKPSLSLKGKWALLDLYQALWQGDMFCSFEHPSL